MPSLTIRSVDLQLAAKAGVDPRTAAKWLRGGTVRGALLDERLRVAATELGLTRG